MRGPNRRTVAYSSSIMMTTTYRQYCKLCGILLAYFCDSNCETQMKHRPTINHWRRYGISAAKRAGVSLFEILPDVYTKSATVCIHTSAAAACDDATSLQDRFHLWLVIDYLLNGGLKKRKIFLFLYGLNQSRVFTTWEAIRPSVSVTGLK
mgnify:CR=1 FL=1